MRHQGVGSNQYRSRPGASVPFSPVPSLLDQAQRDQQTDTQICGQVWGTKCQELVQAPDFSHDDHGLLGRLGKEASRKRCSATGLRLLMAHGSDHVRRAVAMNPASPPDVLIKLYNWSDGPYPTSFRYPLSLNPSCPSQLLENMVNDDGILRTRVMSNPSCPAHLFHTLMTGGDIYHRTGAAQNPRLSESDMQVLARDPYSRVRASLACRTDLPPHLLQQLANDTDNEVRARVAHHPRTPAPILAQLATTEDRRVLAMIADNPNSPPPTLVQLVSRRDLTIRQFLAKNPNSPPEVLQRLMHDKRIIIRRYVAGNPHCPPEVLREALGDPQPTVRKNAERNPNLPEEYRMLIQLVRR